MSPPVRRIAGAPITWGVCEVPGWGYQMSAERVLEEATSIGLRALELGPPGFLPKEPEAARALLARHGLGAAAGFLSVLLHREDAVDETFDAVEAATTQLSTMGATVLLLAARSDDSGYEISRGASPAEWALLSETLERAGELAAVRGVEVVFHPHYGTLVETMPQIEHLLDVSDVPLCIDTGHLLVGGVDPLLLVHAAAERVHHVHLKDVDVALAARVRRRQMGYRAAVRTGMYRPLGDGDINIHGVVEALEAGGYAGWYVLEQDTVLASEPAAGEGPVRDASRSLCQLTEVLV